MIDLPFYDALDQPTDVTSKHQYIQQMHEVYKNFYTFQDIISRSQVNALGRISSVTVEPDRIIATVSNPDFQYIINLEDSRDCGLESMNFGGFEPIDGHLIFNACRYLNNFYGQPFSFLDIGSNHGWYSLAICSMFSDITVHSFEPVPSTFEKLIGNININEFSDRIHAHNLAIINKTGAQEFFFSPTLTGNSSFRDLPSFTNDKMTIEVDCIGLDTFLSSNNMPTPRLVKVDTEGSEKFVVESAHKFILTTRPFLFIELSRKWCAAFNYHPNELLDLFHRINYTCFSILNHELSPTYSILEETLQTNFLFVPSEHSDQFKSEFTLSLH